MPDDVLEMIRRAVSMLADSRYDELSALAAGVRLSPDELREAVDDLPAAVAIPPNSHLAALQAIPLNALPDRSWCVDCDLWIQGGSQSDLTLSLTIIREDDGALRLEIDDLHVL